ncbi:MAG TPA: aminotransferase class V-fold PLP-dependent enzyme [Pirellulales bacterium]|jgi:selenocysteine lyase/cysteine desulfurase|nr:aminotransferase class V-fold PLP-dependent enzyme [Pirellulales bacterium]
MVESLSSDEKWAEFRRQMPVARRWAYFDHAAVAPLPAPARDALVRYAQQAADEGDTVWPAWNRRMEEVRTLGARLIAADADEVALVRNTTEGISLVAEGIAWQPGDNVVTLDNEFPSNLYPWMNLGSRGVETHRVATDGGRVDLDRLIAACDRRTRIVSLSWVGYASGWRTDLADLARRVHARGALLFVDAIQGLGAFPLDAHATEIDFLAADGHKWLLGPEGAGLLYVRKPHLERLRPLGVGWHSVVNAFDYGHVAMDLKPAAARYEGGSANMAGFLALAESLELLIGLDIEAIGRRILEITDLACARLTAAGCTLSSIREGEHRSGIVLFEVPGHDPLAVVARLAREGVVLRCRGGKLRLSPHAYVDESDVDRLIAAIEGLGS